MADIAHSLADVGALLTPEGFIALLLLLQAASAATAVALDELAFIAAPPREDVGVAASDDALDMEALDFVCGEVCLAGVDKWAVDTGETSDLVAVDHVVKLLAVMAAIPRGASAWSRAVGTTLADADDVIIDVHANPFGGLARRTRTLSRLPRAVAAASLMASESPKNRSRGSSASSSEVVD